MKEFSKFFSGLILGDFLVGLWLSLSGDLPISFLGFRISQKFIPFWLGFDAVLFSVLVWYAWGKKVKKKKK